MSGLYASHSSNFYLELNPFSFLKILSFFFFLKCVNFSSIIVSSLSLMRLKFSIHSSQAHHNLARGWSYWFVKALYNIISSHEEMKKKIQLKKQRKRNQKKIIIVNIERISLELWPHQCRNDLN